MMVSEKKNSFFCSCHQEKGEWTITSVLHDAAAVVCFGLVLSFPLVMFWFGTTLTCISFFLQRGNRIYLIVVHVELLCF